MTFAPAALWGGQTTLTASFVHRQFRALWVAGACSSVGQWTLLTARSWVAHEIGGGAGAVGLVVFAQMLPNVFMPPIGGVIADRFNRRTIINITLLISMLSALAMAVLTMSGNITLSLLFWLSLITGMARAVEMPSTQAMVPGLVPQESLLNAVALTGVVTHGSRLLGPLVTLIVLGPFGAGATFLVGAGIYGFGAIMIRRVEKPRQFAHPAGEHPVRQFVDGVRYATREPVIAMIILLVLFHCGLTMSYDALMPAYAHDHVGHGDSSFSLLMMTVGFGSMIGTLVLAGVSAKWHRGRLLFITGLVSGLSPAAMAAAVHWSPALVAAGAMGASQATFMALTNAFLQTATPDRYRGRVLSLFLMIGGGIMAFGNLGAGYLADNWGVGPVLAIPAISFTAVVLLSTYGMTMRGIYRRRTLATAH